MIDFRYHVVSLISVFLALALGIIVGTTTLNGAVMNDLRGEVKSLKNEKNGLHTNVRDLEDQVKAGNDFTKDLSARMVRGELTNSRVLVVATADAPDSAVSGVQNVLHQSGADVTGAFKLTNDFTDSRRAADIKAYVTSGAQPAGFSLPESDDSAVLAGALLGAVSLVDAKTGSTPNNADLNQTLAGLGTLGVLRSVTPEVHPADYAVVVTGASNSNDARERSKELSAFAAQLDMRGKGTVVAGNADSAGAKGVIGVIRNDEGIRSAVSTVDNADSAMGQVAVVLALVQQGKHAAGQYGVAAKADALIPEVAA